MTPGGVLQGRDVGLLITDVGHGNVALPARGLNLFQYRLQRLLAAPAEHHRGALLGKTQGGSLANARTRASDESDLVGESFAHRYPLR
ncbi:hypothetical protein D3C76_1557940 [compost metagenome]